MSQRFVRRDLEQVLGSLCLLGFDNHDDATLLSGNVSRNRHVKDFFFFSSLCIAVWKCERENTNSIHANCKMKPFFITEGKLFSPSVFCRTMKLI